MGVSYKINVEKEKKEILNRYRTLLRNTKDKLSNSDKQTIRKAFNLALEAHKDDRRKSGEPFIYHPIEVGIIVAKEIGLGVNAITCALLHDVVEDTNVTLDEIKDFFGEKICKIIDGLTKISDVFDKDVSIQAENFRKMLITISDDIRVILIKLADRLHNMRTLSSMPNDKQVKIAAETMYLYAPLAHRLGLYNIKTELEDLSLKYTKPEGYRNIATQLSETKDERIKYINRFVNPIRKKLKEQNFKFVIKGRPKSIYSIHKKINKQGIDFEEVFDKFAVRIVVNSTVAMEKADCWKVYSIITDIYNPNPDRLRDWISTPRANGYESLHTTLMGPNGRWVEVQIRTERMDEIAEKGLAAHWKYKENNKIDSKLDEWINRIRDLLAQPEHDALDFVDNFKLNLYSDEIFVFTPKGDLKTLPVNATPLDFAFEIHTEVGASCLGAKVNGKLVPLSYKLKSGDQVDVLTSKKQTPKEDWLNFVVTAKAKSKIKNALNEKKKFIAEEGKAILQRKFRHLKIKFNNQMLNELSSFLKIKDSLEMLYQTGLGEIDNKHLREFATARTGGIYGYLRSKFYYTPPKVEQTYNQQVNKSETKYLVFGKNEERLEFNLARCCNPIQGDKVFGFVTVDRGIKVHMVDCPNALRLQSNFDYRIVEAKWVRKGRTDYKAILKIKGIDKLGLINDLTQVVSDALNINIQGINISGEDGIFEGDLVVVVKNKTHLNTLIQKIMTIEGIQSVNRIYKT